MPDPLCNSDARRLSGRVVLWLLAITVLAAGLRFYRVDAPGFWVDELHTIRNCANLTAIHKTKALGFVPTAIGLQIQGVNLSELVADAPETWQARGVTEWSSRLASVVIGVLSVPLLGIVSCRLLGARVAILLSLLLAVAPWHLYWSQASRFYTQQFLFYNLSLLWYFKATRDGSRIRMVAALAFAVLAFFSQPPGAVIAGVFALDWIIGLARRTPVRLGKIGWIGAALALTVCAVVWMIDYTNRPADWDRFVGDLFHSPAKMILGTVFMTGPAVVFLAAVSAWDGLRRWDRLSVYLVLAAVVPPLAFALVSTFNYVGLRYSFVCLFGWLALAAIGLDRLYIVLREKLGRLPACAPLGLLLISMMLMNYGYFTSGAGFHPRWRDAFAYVARHRVEGELVATSDPIIGKYYLEDAAVQDSPNTREGLAELDRTTWIVIEAEDAIRGRVKSWLDGAAELKGVFDVRVVQPYSSVRVYRFDPEGT